MKYFLRKTKLKRGEYLQIYISEYIRGTGSRNRSYKAIGYTEDLKKRGIEDPVKMARAEVDRLNAAIREEEASIKAKKIGEVSPVKNLGYFLIKGVANTLTYFEKAVKAVSYASGLEFCVYDLMMALSYAYAVFPSKRDALSQLFEPLDDISHDQIISCLEFIGSEYKKIISFLTRSISETYALDVSAMYFDSAAFHFDTNLDDLKCVGLSIALDSNEIPIGMSVYSGDESHLEETMAELRMQNGIEPAALQTDSNGSTRIEESFEVMAEYLSSRPSCLSSFSAIKGHFLICYISMVLERVLERHVLSSRFSHEEIMNFIRSFSVIRKNTRDYINLLTKDDEVGLFLYSEAFPEIERYDLSPSVISKLLKTRLKPEMM